MVGTKAETGGVSGGDKAAVLRAKIAQLEGVTLGQLQSKALLPRQVDGTPVAAESDAEVVTAAQQTAEGTAPTIQGTPEAQADRTSAVVGERTEADVQQNAGQGVERIRGLLDTANFTAEQRKQFLDWLNTADVTAIEGFLQQVSANSGGKLSELNPGAVAQAIVTRRAEQKLTQVHDLQGLVRDKRNSLVKVGVATLRYIVTTAKSMPETTFTQAGVDTSAATSAPPIETAGAPVDVPPADADDESEVPVIVTVPPEAETTGEPIVIAEGDLTEAAEDDEPDQAEAPAEVAPRTPAEKANGTLKKLIVALGKRLSSAKARFEGFMNPSREIQANTAEWFKLIDLADNYKFRELFTLRKLRKHQAALTQLLQEDALTQDAFSDRFAAIAKDSVSRSFTREKLNTFTAELFKQLRRPERAVTSAGRPAAPADGTLADEPQAEPTAEPVELPEKAPVIVTVPTETEAPAPAAEKVTVEPALSAEYKRAVAETRGKELTASGLAIFQNELKRLMAEVTDDEEQDEKIVSLLDQVRKHMTAYLSLMAVRGVTLELPDSERATYVAESKDDILALITKTESEMAQKLQEAQQQNRADLFSDEDRLVAKYAIAGLQMSLVGFVKQAETNPALATEFKNDLLPPFRNLVTRIMSYGIEVI